MASDEEQDEQCTWSWPVWCIVLTAAAGILLVASIVLVSLNVTTYKKYHRALNQSAHRPFPARHHRLSGLAARSSQK